jgi:hypothetical protein
VPSGGRRPWMNSSKRESLAVAFVVWPLTTSSLIVATMFGASTALSLGIVLATVDPPPRSHTASTSTPTSRRPLHPSTSHLKQPPTEPDTLTPSQDIAATTMPVCTDMATHRPTLTERIPSGSPVQRVERVKACVSFTAEMVATESDYHFRGLIAITI